MDETEDVCDQYKYCGNSASDNYHMCPYKQEVYDDKNTRCKCCDKCTQICFDDV